jgi:hypothetical protein
VGWIRGGVNLKTLITLQNSVADDEIGYKFVWVEDKKHRILNCAH